MSLSVATQTTCTLVEIPGAVLSVFAKKYHPVLEVLRRVCKQRFFVSALARAPLFRELTELDRQHLAEYLSPVHAAKGSIIIAEGAADKSIYVIKSGKVGVYTALREQDEVQVLQAERPTIPLFTLQEGDLFGEESFLTKEPRANTVIALTDVELLKLPEQELDSLVRAHPQISVLLAEQYWQRTQAALKVIQSMLAT